MEKWGIVDPKKVRNATQLENDENVSA